MRVLNVAEKPSVAKEVSRILSNGSARFQQTCAPYNGLYCFPYTLQGRQCEMTFTSVAGHLMSLDFTAAYKSWRSCNPRELYTAPIQKSVPQDKQALKNNLVQQARSHQWLVLWLDCDREGENIAFEVIEVCVGANPRLTVWRARFSALILRDLQRAVNNLVQPNEDDSKAVDARQEIDLRIGASFTRFQTLLLQDKFQWGEFAGAEGQTKLLSYGPCQFPTLGLIVQRAWEIQAHVAEDFWYIHVSYQAQDGSGCDFQWDRERIFDLGVALVLYEACVEKPQAKVTKVQGNERFRHPPPPLSTLEMQKKATGSLRIAGERVMKLAEELYQSGFISYPRTETDTFEDGYDLMAMVQEQANDHRWGQHAQKILDGSMWKPPANGGHNDKAHPPIHPTKHSSGQNDWSREKTQLYEFIVRSFLATCSKSAVGKETRIEIDIAEESFHTTGLMVIERNWLEVYPYTRWGGNANLPVLTVNQTFMPTELLLKDGKTQPPPRLSERDLIALMENYGIGTDATVAQHIQNQLDRQYATKDGSLLFWPTPLGEGLVSGYKRMGLQNLWLPDLRGKIEHNISLVAQRQRTKEDVLQEAINHFTGDFRSASQQKGILEAEMARFFARNHSGGFHGHQNSGNQNRNNNYNGGNQDGGNQNRGNQYGGNRNGFGPHVIDGQRFNSDGLPDDSEQGLIGPCIECGCPVYLHTQPYAHIKCNGHPLCNIQINLPRTLISSSVAENGCPHCIHGAVQKVHLKFRRSTLPPGVSADQTVCILCDEEAKQLLQMLGGNPNANNFTNRQGNGIGQDSAIRGGSGQRGNSGNRGLGRGISSNQHRGSPLRGNSNGTQTTMNGRARGGRQLRGRQNQSRLQASSNSSNLLTSFSMT